MSFKVVDVDIRKKLVTSACYDEQHRHVGNYFHDRQANSSKITTVCGGTPI